MSKEIWNALNNLECQIYKISSIIEVLNLVDMEKETTIKILHNLENNLHNDLQEVWTALRKYK